MPLRYIGRAVRQSSRLPPLSTCVCVRIGFYLCTNGAHTKALHKRRLWFEPGAFAIRLMGASFSSSTLSLLSRRRSDSGMHTSLSPFSTAFSRNRLGHICPPFFRRSLRNCASRRVHVRARLVLLFHPDARINAPRQG